MNKLHWVFLLALFASLRAADDAVPPHAPFFKVPERAAWEIDISTATDASAGAQPANPVTGRQLVHVESVKIGDVKHDVLAYSDGGKDEVWYRGNYRVVGTTDPHIAMVLAPPVAESIGLSADPVFCPGFPAVDWIVTSDYRKPVSQASTLCYFFERDDKASALGQVWIDVHSGLPVLAQVGPVKFQFKFKPAPEGELTLPPVYAEAWARFEKLEARRRLVNQPVH